MTLDIPKGFDLAEIRVTLIDKISLSTIEIRTVDEGGGAFLRLALDAGGHEGFCVNPDELEAIARIGRELATLVDGGQT